jgi:hypothetical protein
MYELWPGFHYEKLINKDIDGHLLKSIKTKMSADNLALKCDLTEKWFADFIIKRRLLASRELEAYHFRGSVEVIDSNSYGSVFKLKEYQKYVFKTLQYINPKVGHPTDFLAIGEKDKNMLWVYRFNDPAIWISYLGEPLKYHISMAEIKSDIDPKEILNETCEADFEIRKTLLNFGQLECLNASGKVVDIFHTDYGTVFTLENNCYVYKTCDIFNYKKGDSVKFLVISERRQDIWAFNFPNSCLDIGCCVS